MSKYLAAPPTTAEHYAGGFLISTGQAADMSCSPIQTMTDDTDLGEGADRKRISTLHQQITKALAESRRARHHRDCHCQMFDRQWCNAADALWQRAVNRQLEDLFEEMTQ